MSHKKKKSYGQHFLHDKGVIQKIIEAANVQEGEVVAEIGPGEGALTQGLQALGAKLILVEADPDLIEPLSERFPDAKIVNDDAAQVHFDELIDGPWKLVGNLPYNAAGAIIVNALEAERPPEELIVMTQKEHADRMRAKPGDMGLLSVVVQLTSDIKKLFDVKAGAFVPPPNVVSTVMSIRPRKEVLDVAERGRIIALAKAGFAARRKQLQKNLSDAGITTSDHVKSALEAMNLSPTARAQELSIENWENLRKSVE